jgi:LysR family transcriptional regulator, transcriptional activator of nhaA
MATLARTGGAHRALRIGAQSTLSRNFQIGFLRPVLGWEDAEIMLRSGSGRKLLDPFSMWATGGALEELAYALAGA